MAVLITLLPLDFVSDRLLSDGDDLAGAQVDVKGHSRAANVSESDGRGAGHIIQPVWFEGNFVGFVIDSSLTSGMDNLPKIVLNVNYWALVASQNYYASLFLRPRPTDHKQIQIVLFTLHYLILVVGFPTLCNHSSKLEMMVAPSSLFAKARIQVIPGAPRLQSLYLYLWCQQSAKVHMKSSFLRLLLARSPRNLFFLTLLNILRGAGTVGLM